MGDHPTLCGLSLAALAFIVPTTLDLFTGKPVSGGQDEASYLLAADTFAEGRLANPTHRYWQHFETFHVIHQPTYVSKFPPMQGLFLAAGQVFGGHPAVGIRLGTAFMCAAIFWMLFVWLPPRWALLGGVLALGQFGLLGYWAHTYWGGAVAAGGGALALGSTRRLVDAPSGRTGIVLGLGFGILANSRPFEGLILALFCLAVLARASRKGDPEYRRATLRRVVPPVAIVLSTFAVAMGVYFWQTTGSPVKMPYQVYQETYSPYSLFQLSEPGPVPEYRHDVMRNLYIMWESRPSPFKQPLTYAIDEAWKLAWLYAFYFGVLGILPILGLRRAWQNPWVRFAIVVVVSIMSLSLLTFAFPHYISPVTGLIIFIVVEAIRGLSQIRWKWMDGIKLAALTLVLFAVGLAIRLELHLRPLFPSGFKIQQAEVIRSLEDAPGEHLVFVRYLDGHIVHNEWVYNRADIDASGIVWARDMGPARNAELVSYFGTRKVWLLESGRPEGQTLPFKQEVIRLEPYSVGADSHNDKDQEH